MLKTNTDLGFRTHNCPKAFCFTDSPDSILLEQDCSTERQLIFSLRLEKWYCKIEQSDVIFDKTHFLNWYISSLFWFLPSRFQSNVLYLNKTLKTWMWIIFFCCYPDTWKMRKNAQGFDISQQLNSRCSNRTYFNPPAEVSIIRFEWRIFQRTYQLKPSVK